MAAQSAAMSDHLVRVGNLKAIQKDRGWIDSELARQCGRAPQQVMAWYRGTRKIGERLARSLEERLELARYALDDRGGFNAASAQPPGFGGAAGSRHTVTRRLREVPVIRWAEISTMLEVDNASLKQKAPHLDTFAPTTPHSKFVEMPDDSMAPEFQPGDHALFNPGEAPRAGDVVLVKLASDEYFVRTFRPRTAYIFDAVALNPNYQPLSSAEDGAIVVAVMVEHRRYRRTI